MRLNYSEQKHSSIDILSSFRWKLEHFRKFYHLKIQYKVVVFKNKWKIKPKSEISNFLLKETFGWNSSENHQFWIALIPKRENNECSCVTIEIVQGGNTNNNTNKKTKSNQTIIGKTHWFDNIYGLFTVSGHVFRRSIFCCERVSFENTHMQNLWKGNEFEIEICEIYAIDYILCAH